MKFGELVDRVHDLVESGTDRDEEMIIRHDLTSGTYHFSVLRIEQDMTRTVQIVTDGFLREDIG